MSVQTWSPSKKSKPPAVAAPPPPPPPAPQPRPPVVPIPVPQRPPMPDQEDLSNFVALDVEHTPVLGGGSKPTQISIVDGNLKTLLNEFIVLEGTPQHTPKEKRARNNIRFGRTRRPYADVKPQVEEILKDKIIIGHDLNTDFNVLGLDIRGYNIIDTARLRIFMQRQGSSLYSSAYTPRALKNLVETHLKKKIQGSIHDSLIDATANMELFLKFKEGKQYEFPHPYNTIEFARRVANDARRYGLLYPKYTGPNLMTFPAQPAPPAPPPPINYTANLEQVFSPVARGYKITKEMENLPIANNLLNMNRPRTNTRRNLKYERNLEDLFTPAKSGNLINTHMRNLQATGNLLEMNASPATNLRYEGNLQGLLPQKPKGAWQKVKNLFTRKARKNRK